MRDIPHQKLCELITTSGGLTASLPGHSVLEQFSIACTGFHPYVERRIDGRLSIGFVSGAKKRLAF